MILYHAGVCFPLQTVLKRTTSKSDVQASANAALTGISKVNWVVCLVSNVPIKEFCFYEDCCQASALLTQ